MNESQFRHLLDRYVQEKCTLEETDLLHQFYESFQAEPLEGEPDALDMWLREEKMYSNIKRNIARRKN